MLETVYLDSEVIDYTPRRKRSLQGNESISDLLEKIINVPNSIISNNLTTNVEKITNFKTSLIVNNVTATLAREFSNEEFNA